jgi:hypothetical protein
MNSTNKLLFYPLLLFLLLLTTLILPSTTSSSNISKFHKHKHNKKTSSPQFPPISISPPTLPTRSPRPPVHRPSWAPFTSIPSMSPGRKAGHSCAKDSACLGNLFCLNGKCVPDAKPNKICTRPEMCLSNCCQENQCKVGPRESCSSDGDCCDDLWCCDSTKTHSSCWQGLSTGKHCMKRALLGELCSYPTDNLCTTGYFCDFRGSHTCRIPDYNATCTNDASCYRSSRCDKKLKICMPRIGQIGDSCKEDGDCPWSGYCSKVASATDEPTMPGGIPSLSPTKKKNHHHNQQQQQLPAVVVVVVDFTSLHNNNNKKCVLGLPPGSLCARDYQCLDITPSNLQVKGCCWLDVTVKKKFCKPISYCLG